MVFGFGKKKDKEKPIQTQPSRTVTLEEIPGIIQKTEDPRISEIVTNSKSIKETIEHHKKNIFAIINKLESDDLKVEDIDKNLRVIVRRGKSSVVNTVKKETSAKLIEISKYEDVIELNAQINQIIKRIGDVLGVNSRIIHIFAKKYADELKNEIAKMAHQRNSLQERISHHENFKLNCNNITKSVKEIIELRTGIKQKDHRLNEMKAELDNIKKSITQLEQEVHNIKSSKEYETFLELKNKINSLAEEKKEIKNKIDMQFTKISRPLGRYSYVSSFDKPMKKLMEEVMHDPYQAISRDNKSAISNILQAVVKSTLSGNISVKDSEKATEYIEETISSLDEFVSLKESYFNKMQDLEKQLRIFDIKLLESKEIELEKAKTRLKELELSTDKIHQEISENNSDITKLMSQIESDLYQISSTKFIVKS